MQSKTYSIPVDRLGDFEKKFKRIKNKAAKLGGLVGYRLGDVVDEEITYFSRDGYGNERSFTHLFRVRKVEVFGEAPVIEGWEVIAVIDHTPALADSPFNIVHNLGSGSSEERFKTMGNDCEHCGFDRQRKKTVVIRHIDTREQKQVGLGCLGDFTGSHDPHHAARLCEYVEKALNNWDGFGSDAEPLIDKHEFLAHVACEIRLGGWVSRGSSGGNRQSTADLALERLRRRQVALARIGTDNETHTDRDCVLGTEFAQEDVDRVDAALEWLEFEADKSNEFIGKLYAALAGSGIVVRHAGIAAALFIAHDKAVSRNAAQQAREVSGHVGVVGERSEFVIQVTGKRSYVKRTYSYYDSSEGVIVMMVDDAGNILKWFTSPGKTEGQLEEGKRFRIAGTVKDHGEFRGTNETTLSRVSVRAEL